MFPCDTAAQVKAGRDLNADKLKSNIAESLKIVSGCEQSLGGLGPSHPELGGWGGSPSLLLCWHPLDGKNLLKGSRATCAAGPIFLGATALTEPREVGKLEDERCSVWLLCTSG